MLALLVQQLFLTFLAFCLKFIIDSIQPGNTADALPLVAAALLVGFVLASVAALGGEWLTARSGGLVMGDLRRQLYEKLQSHVGRILYAHVVG